MLNKEERELLIKTYEKTQDARLTAEIFSVHRSRVYAIVKQYRETGSVEVRTSQCGRKRNEWVTNIDAYNPDTLVFLDESGVNIDMTRTLWSCCGESKSG